MNLVLWSALRWWIRYRRGRLPPASLPDPIWYFAYGSNMNERLFRERRHMTWREARVGRLRGYRLVFTVSPDALAASPIEIMAPGFIASPFLLRLPC